MKAGNYIRDYVGEDYRTIGVIKGDTGGLDFCPYHDEQIQHCFAASLWPSASFLFSLCLQLSCCLSSEVGFRGRLFPLNMFHMPTALVRGMPGST